MFLNTIYEEDFHNFLKNPTDFILSGVVMNENEKVIIIVSFVSRWPMASIVSRHYLGKCAVTIPPA